MKIQLREGSNPAAVGLQQWGTVLHGDCVDDRGTAAVKTTSASTTTSHKVEYSAENLKIQFDDRDIHVDDLVSEIRTEILEPVLIEATTLGFVEILLCSRALLSIGVGSFDVMYVEPKAYRTPRGHHLLHKRDFELTSAVSGYQAIPGHAILLGDKAPQKGVFLLGYEEARLRSAFEDLQMINPSLSNIVFGVPAFNPGWEMDSFANNISVMREKNIRGGVNFCAAENPWSVYELLTEIERGLDESERLFVAPIGTKPHGVGAALFAAGNPNIGVLYDHPTRTSGRSSEVGRWHLYSING